MGDAIEGEETHVVCGDIRPRKVGRQQRYSGKLRNSFTAWVHKRFWRTDDARAPAVTTSSPYDRLMAQEGSYECARRPTDPVKIKKSHSHTGKFVKLRDGAHVEVTKDFASAR